MKLGCDYIIRNAVLKASDQTVSARVDIGINFDKRINVLTGQMDDYATIMEIGDLSAFTALEKEVNANGAELDADLIKLEHPLSMDDVGLLLKRM